MIAAMMPPINAAGNPSMRAPAISSIGTESIASGRKRSWATSPKSHPTPPNVPPAATAPVLRNVDARLNSIASLLYHNRFDPSNSGGDGFFFEDLELLVALSNLGGVGDVRAAAELD